ncbi:hypothetical protein Dimus_025801 [Dionaea muscipula]
MSCMEMRSMLFISFNSLLLLLLLLLSSIQSSACELQEEMITGIKPSFPDLQSEQQQQQAEAVGDDQDEGSSLSRGIRRKLGMLGVQIKAKGGHGGGGGANSRPKTTHKKSSAVAVTAADTSPLRIFFAVVGYLICFLVI